MAALSSTIRASRSRAKRATGSVRPARAAASEAWTTARPSERGRRLVDGQLDEEPAQALLVAGPLADEILAVVDEQADLAVGAVERGHRQVGLAQDGAGDGEGVDRVALARARGRSGGRRP